jgi:hypothetical protein
MSPRTPIVTFTAVAVLGIAVLVAAGARDQRSTAFSPDVGAAGPQVVLDSGRMGCEQQPTYVQARFGSVKTWLVADSWPGASLEMRIYSLSHAALAAGRIAAGYVGPVTPTFELSRTVAAGQQVIVCIGSAGPKPTGVLGAAGQFTLLFLRPHSEPLLSAIPDIFGRAALFRPTWVGTWTFWLLLALLAIAFVVGGIAVVAAVRSDEAEPDRPT